MIATQHQTGSSSTLTQITELCQITCAETGGAAATVTLRAASSTGTVVMVRKMASGGSFTETFPNPLASTDVDGLPSGSWYVAVTTGAFTWCVSGK